MHKVIVEGRLEGMNEFIKANRGRNGTEYGNKMKRDGQRICMVYIKQALKNRKIREPVRLHYTFYEKDRRRDHDNVSGFFHKVFQDALVAAGYLTNDGWSSIVGYSDDFEVDTRHPRIEILIEEVKDDKRVDKSKS